MYGQANRNRQNRKVTAKQKYDLETDPKTRFTGIGTYLTGRPASRIAVAVPPDAISCQAKKKVSGVDPKGEIKPS
jgi:hypothetical protein